MLQALIPPFAAGAAAGQTGPFLQADASSTGIAAVHQLDEQQEFDFCLEHCNGRDNELADALSRNSDGEHTKETMTTSGGIRRQREKSTPWSTSRYRRC